MSDLRIHRTTAERVQEILVGWVQGKRATDIEERFARALDKSLEIDSYEFQPSYVAGRNLPGEIRLDFMVYAGLSYPFQLDGTYAHKTAQQKYEDAIKDAILDSILTPRGVQPVKRIPGDELETQEEADELVAELF